MSRERGHGISIEARRAAVPTTSACFIASMSHPRIKRAAKPMNRMLHTKHCPCPSGPRGARTSYDLESPHDRSPLSPSPGHELPATVRGGRTLRHNGLTCASDQAMEGQQLQQRGAGSRQLRTARAQCKVHSGAVDPYTTARRATYTHHGQGQTIESGARRSWPGVGRTPFTHARDSASATFQTRSRRFP